ncbi:P-loop containing nucleoside triphosphate hydrolase protein [Hypoxylon cercidicola]|nr:P-loop containing nucleoside triphosphate hydrolase protein [Hypoxylon cercidicola]
MIPTPNLVVSVSRNVAGFCLSHILSCSRTARPVHGRSNIVAMSSDTTVFFQEEVENFMQFTGAEQAKSNSVFIAVMGMTGSGKSSFISAVTGRDDVKIGHELSSCTSSVSIFHHEIGEYNVYFIDTPGFDDTNRSDLEILKAISNFLSVAYANRNYLNGLIYLHQISDTRMGKTKKLNIEMFKALCGEDAFFNVAILTSMWSTDESSAEFAKQVAREEQLKEEYLADILDADGLLRRLKSEDSSTIDVASAKKIFQELFDSWKDDKITLSIQHELINDLVPLSETAAGKVLSFHMNEVYQHYEAEISKLSETIKESRVSTRGLTLYQDESTAVILEHQQCLDQLRADQEAMKMSLLEVHAEEKERLTTQLSAMESRWREELASREREQALREQVLEEMRVSALARDATIAEQQQQQWQAEHRRREQEAAQRQQLRVFATEQERRREWETRYHAQLVQQGRWREEGYRAELKQTRKELEDMRADFEKRMETAGKAKRAWVGPVLEGALTGGLGLAGAMITAGELGPFWHLFTRYTFGCTC